VLPLEGKALLESGRTDRPTVSADRVACSVELGALPLKEKIEAPGVARIPLREVDRTAAVTVAPTSV
jgi:hypothetical protein